MRFLSIGRPGNKATRVLRLRIHMQRIIRLPDRTRPHQKALCDFWAASLQTLRQFGKPRALPLSRSLFLLSFWGYWPGGMLLSFSAWRFCFRRRQPRWFRICPRQALLRRRNLPIRLLRHLYLQVPAEPTRSRLRLRLPFELQLRPLPPKPLLCRREAKRGLSFRLRQ